MKTWTGRSAALVLTVVLTMAASAGGGECDILISGGRVVDGTGNPWFFGDVAVRGDRVVAVGNLSGFRAKRRVDAAGRVVAPGFIDMLGQSELSVLVDPRAESKVFQGITTEVTGEGGSVGPTDDALVARQSEYLSRYGLQVDWRTMAGYFRRLERTPCAINLASLVGASQVRKMVLGGENRAPNPEELGRMVELVKFAMEDGAVGLSCALVYPPGSYAGTGELAALAKAAAPFGGVFAIHLRSEGARQMEALDEALDIGKRAGVPVHVFHLKTAGRERRGRMAEVVARVQSARDGGQDVTADVYPYVAAATGLAACLPAWASEGGVERLLERLGDPSARRRMKKDISDAGSPSENFYRMSGGGGGVLLAGFLDPKLRRFQGVRLDEAARLMGLPDELDALFDLVLADKANADALYFMMSEKDVATAVRQPWAGFGCDHEAVATDGPLSEVVPHPRGFGTFPRVLGRYVREQKALSLEDAVRKMTSLPATRYGLTGRGLVKQGFYADIVVFDPDSISDEATFENPRRLSKGVDLVLVNGVPVLEGGRQTGARPGRPLRRCAD